MSNIKQDPLAYNDSVQIFQGTDDGSPAVISRKIACDFPNSDFNYIVVAVGEGIVDVSVDGLPEGLTYSEDGPDFELRIEEDKPIQTATTGRITGRYAKDTDHVFTITAKNAKGAVTEKVTIKPHDFLAPTPPMGWLSWEWWHEGVTQEKMKQTIDGLDKAGLAKFGYKYVVIDDGWQGHRVDDEPLPSNENFPDIKQLSDYAREKNFVLGIYTCPWINSYMGMEASGYHEEADVKQFVDWNIGYLKLDYRPWDVKHLSLWHDILRSSGKDIVFSFSNHGLVDGGAEFLSDVTDVWRTGRDIVSKWESVYRSVYTQYLEMEGWKYLRKGHWPDPDMLQIGKLRGDVELPENEQHFQMSMWAILPAPLLLSSDANSYNKFHLKLLTNEEVIAVNQDSLGLPAKPVVDGKLDVLYKPLADGTVAVGFFNPTESEAEITVNFAALGFTGNQQIRDIWKKQDLGKKPAYTASIGSHCARLFIVGVPDEN